MVSTQGNRAATRSGWPLAPPRLRAHAELSLSTARSVGRAVQCGKESPNYPLVLRSELQRLAVRTTCVLDLTLPLVDLSSPNVCVRMPPCGGGSHRVIVREERER